MVYIRALYLKIFCSKDMESATAREDIDYVDGIIHGESSMTLMIGKGWNRLRKYFKLETQFRH
tara:strand:- start:593 stop:781 length:189 start_codon:yes stop_codon:yes gene_type:complete